MDKEMSLRQLPYGTVIRRLGPGGSSFQAAFPSATVGDVFFVKEKIDGRRYRLVHIRSGDTHRWTLTGSTLWEVVDA